jgi:hypothetical protein
MPRGREHLRPFDVVALAGARSREEFAESFCDDKLMLVELTEQPESLLRGLLENTSDVKTPWYARSDTTGRGTSLATRYTRDDIEKRIASMPAPLDGRSLARLLTLPHFIAPIRKRAEALIKDPERISVGRSSANDIVLIHPTVSKQHAWMEYDDQGQLFVYDSRSTNFTRVRGRIIEPLELTSFAKGDAVQFGDVVIRLCEAETLWDALNLEDT